MTDYETGLSPAQVAQTNANLRLAEQFIQELLNRPEDADPIPLGAAVVLLPPEDQDDAELRQANLRMAGQLAAEGRIVVLWTIGGEASAAYQTLVSQGAAAGDR